MKAIDAALDRARRGARRISSRRSPPPTRIRACSSASRSGCSRCARPGRKYNAPVDDLAALAARYARRSRPDRRRRRAARRARRRRPPRRRALYAKAAALLSERRRRVAETLDKAVNGELKPLKLERARFSTAIDTDAAAAGPHGIDRVEFWVRTNPGTQPGPLMKVASGGELARFLLALKVVIADRGSAPTLVFDEIDTGVGGAVADAIGVRLARLGRRVQALAVTHAPQVAARADHHYLITKDVARRASGWRRASPSSSPRAGARRSPACSPAPRSPTRRAPPPSG